MSEIPAAPGAAYCRRCRAERLDDDGRWCATCDSMLLRGERAAAARRAADRPAPPPPPRRTADMRAYQREYHRVHRGEINARRRERTAAARGR